MTNAWLTNELVESLDHKMSFEMSHLQSDTKFIVFCEAATFLIFPEWFVFRKNEPFWKNEKRMQFSGKTFSWKPHSAIIFL